MLAAFPFGGNAFVETKTFIKDYTYQAGELDSKESCRLLIAEEDCAFYREEIGGTLPDVIEELPYLIGVCCDDGTVKTVKARINEELDTRNSWLIMGIPCELHQPFVIGTLP